MDISKASSKRIHCAWWLLRLTYGLLFIVAGADKFLNMITVWVKYVSPMTVQYIAIQPGMLMQGVGILEIVLGFMILTKFTRLGAHLAALWLLVIAANLISLGFPYDIAVRDIVMAVGACVLGCLTPVKKELCCSKTVCSIPGTPVTPPLTTPISHS